MAETSSLSNDQLVLAPFEVDPSLESWSVPAKEWLQQHDKHWDGIASAVLVFNDTGDILIVQRAAHDSMPNKWEVPGGAVDATDATILHGAARELWEEAGLVAKRFTQIATEGAGVEPGYLFTNRTGQRIFCRFTFHADVESTETVTLDPNEHQAYLWVSEEEWAAQRAKDGRDIPATHPSVLSLLLEGFRLRKVSASNAA